MDAFQSISSYMHVDLGGGDVGMTEHNLHRPQIRSPLQQMGGISMAKGVGMHFFFHPGGPGVFLNQLP